MKYKRYNLVGVVENVFEDRDIVWPGNGIIEKNKITTVYDNKITLKDIKKYVNRLKAKCINNEKSKRNDSCCIFL